MNKAWRYDVTRIDAGDDLPVGVWYGLTIFQKVTEADGVVTVTVSREIAEIPDPPLHGEDE